jgi:putative tricarboxylic transport membrane protein
MLEGLWLALQPQNMFLAFAGAALGVVFGGMPGISATLGIALLVPLTFDMPPVAALVFLGGVYCGAIYGGSISGILLNVPGTPAAVASMIDGHEMTKQGKGGQALGTAILASLFGGQVSVLILLFAAPLVAAAALEIRSAEFFWIVLFAMTTVGAIGTDQPIKGLIAGLIGLAIGTIGMHPLTGSLRYTFGQTALYEGVPVIVGLVGLFSISQVLTLGEGHGMDRSAKVAKIGSLWPGWGNLWPYRSTFVRSAFLGTGVGVIPGAGADIAAFLGRSEAQRLSKEPERYGKGSPEAVIGAETANNAVVGGSLVPMLTLGIPGNAVTAALLGGLLIHGLIPGPRLFENHGDVLYPFIFSLFLANLFFAVFGFAALRYIARIILVPQGIIAPVVMALAVIGAFAYRNLAADIWIMLALGLLGYGLRKAGFPLAPIILGIILGPLAEENLDRVVTIADARNMSLLEYFFSRTATILFMALTVLALG